MFGTVDVQGEVRDGVEEAVERAATTTNARHPREGRQMEGQQMHVQEIEVPVHQIDREIYGMPAFAN